jgi:hypothetical protein
MTWPPTSGSSSRASSLTMCLDVVPLIVAQEDTARRHGSHSNEGNMSHADELTDVGGVFKQTRRPLASTLSNLLAPLMPFPWHWRYRYTLAIYFPIQGRWTSFQPIGFVSNRNHTTFTRTYWDLRGCGQRPLECEDPTWWLCLVFLHDQDFPMMVKSLWLSVVYMQDWTEVATVLWSHDRRGLVP